MLKSWPRDAALAGIPLLIGTTKTEATFWYDLVGPDGKAIPGLQPPSDRLQLVSMVRDLAAMYRPEAAGVLPEQVVEAYTDIVFRLRARTAATRHAAAGHPTFPYEFDRPLAAPAHGVPHTAEIPFVFGTYSDPFFASKVGAGADAAALSASMLRAWARFAHLGVPGAEWVAATETAPRINLLGGPAGPHAINTGSRLDELAAWKTA